jgi:hypothetical protein
LVPFLLSLSRFRKEANSAAPSGTPPAGQIPSAEKKPDPPVRPARPPRPFVTQEAHLGRSGLGALEPTYPLPPLCHSGCLLWLDRTGALLSPCPPQPTGDPSLPPSHFDGVCDISCCEVKEGPLRPAPFSCSLLVHVSVFPLVRLSSKQVMVEVPCWSAPDPQPSLHPLLPSLPTAGPHKLPPLDAVPGTLPSPWPPTPHMPCWPVLALALSLPMRGSPARSPLPLG